MVSSSLTDAELVTAAVGGDHDAFASIYDRYADRVFSLCLTSTRDRGLAEDAMADTFLTAWQRMAQLRDRTRLRPWLFAIARNRVARTGAKAARQVPVDPFGVDMRDHTGPDGGEDTDVVDAIVGDDAVALVWEAAAGLNDNERAVLELSVRQGMEGEELATALGVTRHNANVIATRMRRNLERSIGALYLLRFDDGGCVEFSELVAGQSGSLTPLWRKRISRHADDCDICSRRRAPKALAIFGESPVSAAPIAARSKVLGALGGAGVVTGVAVGAPFRVDRAGFPTAGRRLRRIVRGVGLLLALLVLLVGGAVVLDDRDPGTAVDATATTIAPIAPADGASTTTNPDGAPVSSIPTTTSTPTSTSASTTTTLPSDAGAPALTSVTMTPTALTSGSTSCTVPGPRTAVLTVTGTDDVGIVGGSARATIFAGGVEKSLVVTLSGSGSAVTGTVGPFVSGLGSFRVVDLTVVDAAGNRSPVWPGAVIGGVSC